MKCTWNASNSACRAYSMWIFNHNEEYLAFYFMIMQMFLTNIISLSVKTIFEMFPLQNMYLPQRNQKTPSGI